MLVDALLEEFRADARRVLAPPEAEEVTIDDFWMFLHLLLECTASYRFLFRDLESLAESYPSVGRSLGHFAKGLAAMFELYLRGLSANGLLGMSEDDSPIAARNLAVIALFSDRFDTLTGKTGSADDSALRIAGSILNALKPFAAASGSAYINDLAAHYDV
jgi:hypothetical protein